MTRLTDEEAWLRYHLLALEWGEYANNAAGLECEADEEADRQLAKFRKRFPAETAVEPELVVEWEDYMDECIGHCTAGGFRRSAKVKIEDDETASYTLYKESDSAGFYETGGGFGYTSMRMAKQAAEAALRKELGK